MDEAVKKSFCWFGSDGSSVWKQSNLSLLVSLGRLLVYCLRLELGSRYLNRPTVPFNKISFMKPASWWPALSARLGDERRRAHWCVARADTLQVCKCAESLVAGCKRARSASLVKNVATVQLRQSCKAIPPNAWVLRRQLKKTFWHV